MTRVLEILGPRAVVATVLVAATALSLAVLPASTGANAPETQGTPPRQDYNAGPYLFRTFCAACHGERGTGDGPVAALLVAPVPDLTTVAARAEGRFSRPDVYAAIDGRRAVPSHGPSGMPIWGDVLKSTEGRDDAIVKQRIEALVLHVESLQRK